MTTIEKIRAEIEQERVHNDWDLGQERYYNNAIDDVLAIIDKYNPKEEEWYRAIVEAFEPCDDAIDRAEAMTVIMMFAGNAKPDEEDIYIKVSDAVQLLRELPSVRPQPCEDAVSRQAVYEILEGNWNTDFLRAEVEKLPSVRPQEQTGHWIIDKGSLDALYGEVCKCSECGAESIGESDYCPYCGARMIGEE